MRRLVSVLLALVCLPVVVNAQQTVAGATYNYSFPAVDIDRYVGADSWYGFSVDFRQRLNNRPNLMIGISSGWHVFYSNVDNVIELENGAVSGEQYRNFNIIPILANATYLLGQDGQTRPYIALHAGAYWARQGLDLGLYRHERDNWHFGIAPEFGVNFPTSATASVYFNARYHYLFSAGEYLGGDAMTLSFLTLGVGVAWSGI